jgi:putative oxidoreductase
LLLRVGSGATMAYSHGWSKFSGFSEMSTQFPDPIGIGVVPSLALAMFAEFFCALLLIPGVFTRLAALPLAITMLVAAFVQHASDPFAKKELALVYLVMFLCVACAGPGRFSVDNVFRKTR